MGSSIVGFRLNRFFLIPVVGLLIMVSAFSMGKGPRLLVSPKDNVPLAKFAIDKSKSSVAFTVTHMVVSEAEGVFRVFNGSMETSKSDYSDAAIEFSVDMKSVNTGNDNRDRHLKGPDFFDVSKFPSMRFVSTSFVHQDGSNYQLSGNLTIKTVTKPVIFTVSYAGLSSDQKTAVFNAKTSIDRFDYGLVWSKMTEAGGLVVSREVKVNVTAAFKVK